MRTIKRPAFYFSWEALDVGFVDKTAWLAGYVDFSEGLIVVEDEFLLARASTTEIGDAIETHERALWGNEKFSGGFKQPHKRVSDIDHRLIADLRQNHRLDFTAIEKKNFSSDINLVNVLLGGKQLLVSETCVQLRRQLAMGTYNTTHKDMAKDSLGGHYDALAALRYGCRIAEPMLRHNPYPPGYRETPWSPTLYIPAPEEKESSGLQPDTDFARRNTEEQPAAELQWWHNPY